MTQKFRKKSIDVEAVQFTDKNKDQVYSWTRSIQANIFPDFENGKPCLMIPTLDGEMRCSLEDWLIVEPFPTDWRKIYPCKPDIFDKTYEAAGSQIPGSRPTWVKASIDDLQELQVGLGSAIAIFNECGIVVPDDHEDPSAISDFEKNVRYAYDLANKLVAELATPTEQSRPTPEKDAVLMELIEWERKHPPGRIYPMEQAAGMEKALTAIVEKAKQALTTTPEKEEKP